MKILVVYYSRYGHIKTMAEAVAEGAAGARVKGCRRKTSLKGPSSREDMWHR